MKFFSITTVDPIDDAIATATAQLAEERRALDTLAALGRPDGFDARVAQQRILDLTSLLLRLAARRGK